LSTRDRRPGIEDHSQENEAVERTEERGVESWAEVLGKGSRYAANSICLQWVPVLEIDGGIRNLGE